MSFCLEVWPDSRSQLGITHHCASHSLLCRLLPSCSRLRARRSLLAAAMGSGAAVAFVVLGFACLIMGVVVVAGCCSRHSFLLAPRVGEYHAPLIE